jgi:hypothetical protein
LLCQKGKAMSESTRGSGGREVVRVGVDLANKNARILWAVMTKGTPFDRHHVSVKPGGGTASTNASINAPANTVTSSI